MKKKNFQKTLFIVGILAFISGYSNDNDYDECEDYKSTFQGHAAPKDQMQKKYNHPARIDVKGSWDYYISGSYIYWQPREDGLELAREANIQNPIDPEIDPLQKKIVDLEKEIEHWKETVRIMSGK